jgi:hypothetical protein
MPQPFVELLRRGMDADPEKRPTLSEFLQIIRDLKADYEANPGPWDAVLPKDENNS